MHHLTEDEVLQAAHGGRGPAARSGLDAGPRGVPGSSAHAGRDAGPHGDQVPSAHADQDAGPHGIQNPSAHAGGLAEARRAHLDGCEACAARVAGMRNVAAALREAEPEVRPPSFDALIAPALAAERAAPAAEHTPAAEEPAPPRPLSAAGAARLVTTLVLRQARLVPTSLWPLTAAAIGVLLLFAGQAPDPAAGAAFFGPAATLLTTGAALAVCSPTRDPRSEMLYAMRVPPAVVWLARLVFVLGAVLGALAAASAVSAAVLGAPQDTAALIASWLGPAALGAAVTVFGTVWRSPAVGAVFGAGSWLMHLVATRGAGPVGALPSGARDTIGALWATGPLSLLVSAVLLAAAVWLVSRPGRSLDEGARG